MLIFPTLIFRAPNLLLVSWISLKRNFKKLHWKNHTLSGLVSYGDPWHCFLATSQNSPPKKNLHQFLIFVWPSFWGVVVLRGFCCCFQEADDLQLRYLQLGFRGVRCYPRSKNPSMRSWKCLQWGGWSQPPPIVIHKSRVVICGVISRSFSFVVEYGYNFSHSQTGQAD